MALFQNGVDVSRYQGSINWTQVAAAGKQFAIVRVGSSNSGGLYVDPYFLQNVTGAHSAGLRVGAYYYTYARTRAAVASELTAFLNILEGIKLEYPVFVDVEDASLTSLGRALAKEEGPSGVTVNIIAPGVIDTDMMASFTDEDRAALAEEKPVERLGTAEDVARAIVFLCDENAGYITGQVLGVNGGLVI